VMLHPWFLPLMTDDEYGKLRAESDEFGISQVHATNDATASCCSGGAYEGFWRTSRRVMYHVGNLQGNFLLSPASWVFSSRILVCYCS